MQQQNSDWILQGIAQNGKCPCEWNELKAILQTKIIEVLDKKFSSNGFVGSITETFESRRDLILDLVRSYESTPPFTIQRLAELLCHPEQYKACHKLMNALERLLSVSSAYS